MQEVKAYNITSRWDVRYVPLQNIIIDKSILKVISEHDPESEKKFMISPRVTVPLTRMINPMYKEFDKDAEISIINAMKNNVKMPPIDVKKAGTYYTILQGRHRTSASIILNYTHVPVIVRE